jgi:hypothetical protein
MPYLPFYLKFPEIAQRETRTVTLSPKSGFDLPAGHYTFLEMFCDEPGCDCRRAFFFVSSSRREQAVAVITYGWEDRDFYVKWMGDDEPEVIESLKGPALNLSSPQSRLAPAVLELFQKVLLQDRDYIERVKKHYGLFRAGIDRKSRKRRRVLPEPR